MDQVLNKWNRAVRLEKYADDDRKEEANRRVRELLPSEEEMKAVWEGT